MTKTSGFLAAPIDKALLMFSPVLRLSIFWECMRRWAQYAAQQYRVLPARLWNTGRKALPKRYYDNQGYSDDHRLTWEVRERRSSEESSLSSDTGKALILQTIYSGVSTRCKQGSQHSPRGLVLLLSALQDGALIQSLGCGSLANLILPRTCCCKLVIYCQPGPKSAQT